MNNNSVEEGGSRRRVSGEGVHDGGRRGRRTTTGDDDRQHGVEVEVRRSASSNTRRASGRRTDLAHAETRSANMSSRWASSSQEATPPPPRAPPDASHTTAALPGLRSSFPRWSRVAGGQSSSRQLPPPPAGPPAPAAPPARPLVASPSHAGLCQLRPSHERGRERRGLQSGGIRMKHELTKLFQSGWKEFATSTVRRNA